MTEQPSGRLYSAVTKYWPRIAAGLVALAVVLEWAIGGLTANGAVEFYVLPGPQRRVGYGSCSRKPRRHWLALTSGTRFRTVVSAQSSRAAAAFSNSCGSENGLGRTSMARNRQASVSSSCLGIKPAPDLASDGRVSSQGRVDRRSQYAELERLGDRRDRAEHIGVH